MKTIQEQEQEIVAEFSMYDDWMDKYAYLIELGAAMEPMEERRRVEANLIAGCQSRVWLHAEEREGRVYLQADSDALIPKGIVALLLRVFSGQPTDDILAADLEFINTIGLSSHLAPTRANGLLSMIKQVKLYALAYAK
ncbi:MAG: SufE family protein [Odoribacteraceae bacterium]|jgi:cysteine desulfuration protein SufE|nr:SufE family protein [Odoribacteraceae bacterium]